MWSWTHVKRCNILEFLSAKNQELLVPHFCVAIALVLCDDRPVHIRTVCCVLASVTHNTVSCCTSHQSFIPLRMHSASFESTHLRSGSVDGWYWPPLHDRLQKIIPSFIVIVTGIGPRAPTCRQWKFVWRDHQRIRVQFAFDSTIPARTHQLRKDG